MCGQFLAYNRRRFILRQAGLWDACAHAQGRAHFSLALIDGAVNAAHPAFGGCRISTIGVSQSVRAADHATFSASIFVGGNADRKAGRVMALCAGGTLFNYAFVTDEMLTGDISIRATARMLATAVHLAVDAGCGTIVFGIEMRHSESDDWRPLRDSLLVAARAGSAVFLPAGNRSGAAPQALCNWPGVLVTASCNWQGNTSIFSPHPVLAGTAIFAPGEDIPGAGPGNGYTIRSGTSFAAAVAASACELARGLAPCRPSINSAAALWPPPRRILDGTTLFTKWPTPKEMEDDHATNDA